MMYIKELTIYSTHPSGLAKFYHEFLDLPMNNVSSSEFIIQIGKTQLKIRQSKEMHPYHFAINIPSNKILEALDWLEQRVLILKFEGDRVHDFTAWNAKAIYFYDRDNNIVELIARKNLFNSSLKTFDADAFLEVSEIGIPVSDLPSLTAFLQREYGLPKYYELRDDFCAIGDELGLFICIDMDKKQWFPTGEKAFASPFKILFEKEGRVYGFEFRDEMIIPRSVK